jgi:Domain of unknown function (DUF4190)
MSELTYQVVGKDAKVYGPAGAELVRQWIAEGRLNSLSTVLPAGAPAWTTLGALPEFAGAFAPPKAPLSSPPPGRQTHSLATAGLICGILSICFCCVCCFPVDLLGLILSLIALVQINEHPDRYTGRVEAIIGLVLSGAAFLFFLASCLSNQAHTHLNRSFYY